MKALPIAATITAVSVAATGASPAIADEANPDADRLLRVFCYQVRYPDDPSTRNPSFTVVMQQVSTEPYDASYFIEGNQNFEELFVGPSPMTINVYRDGQPYSEADISVQAEELLGAAPSLSFDGKVERYRTHFIFGFDQGQGTGRISYEIGQQNLNIYSLYGENDQRGIFCEPLYSVDAE